MISLSGSMEDQAVPVFWVSFYLIQLGFAQEVGPNMLFSGAKNQQVIAILNFIYFVVISEFSFVKKNFNEEKKLVVKPIPKLFINKVNDTDTKECLCVCLQYSTFCLNL
jgi:hypothetical protein